MNTKPRSFRLSKKALDTLAQLSKDFEISENKTIEILLTEAGHIDGSGTPRPLAQNVIKQHFISKISQ
jgi:hypothetical protein